jgi:polysaccharide deacetylase 2 family uncharacterized protein YibQ
MDSFAPPAMLLPAPAPAIVPAQAVEPAWRRFAVKTPPADGRPILALMIDDMGINRVQTLRAVALPAPLTLSWLPYARHLADQVAEGAGRGHETMLHMPMQPMGHLDPGPNALRIDLPEAQNLEYLSEAFASMPSAVGLNQHEGSVASLSVPLMDLVMRQLVPRQMLFIDSLTVIGSVALREARAAGLPSLPRDVFIDNTAGPAQIRGQLAHCEVIARRYGLVIAIAHPRTHTIDVLEQELPRMIDRGVVLWPISAAVAARGLMAHPATS